MLFTTPEFIIFFISVLAVISCIKFRKFQHLFLIGSSYFFFYFSNNFLITLLIFSTLLDFYVGKAIFTAKDKAKKVTSRLSLVEHQLAKELKAQGTYIASPKILKWYCISCAIHFKILKIRSSAKRREHTKLR